MLKQTLLCIVLIASACIPQAATAGRDRDITLTGWMDTAFRDNDKSGNKPGIDAHHLYLILRTAVHDGIEVFGEVEFEHIPNSGKNKGSIKLERLYSQINIVTALNVRIGKFNTPFGYWTPRHWAILVETIEKPIHENNHYIPPKNVGVESFGRIFLGSHDIEWNAFISNGSEYEGTDTPDDRTFGGGADARLNLVNETAFVGLSAYNQHNPSTTATAGAAPNGRSETSVIGYAGGTVARLTLSTEVFFQKRGRNSDGVDAPDISTFYINGKIRLDDDIALGARYDSGDDDKTAQGGRKIMTTVYLNWTPTVRTIAKLELSRHTLKTTPRRTFHSWGAYFGVMF